MINKNSFTQELYLILAVNTLSLVLELIGLLRLSCRYKYSTISLLPLDVIEVQKIVPFVVHVVVKMINYLSIGYLNAQLFLMLD
jgi:hypothetical protein